MDRGLAAEKVKSIDASRNQFGVFNHCTPSLPGRLSKNDAETYMACKTAWCRDKLRSQTMKLMKQGRSESNKTDNMSQTHNTRGDCEESSQE